MLIHGDFIHNYKKSFSKTKLFSGGKKKSVILKELGPYLDREQTGLGPWLQCKGERAETGGGEGTEGDDANEQSRKDCSFSCLTLYSNPILQWVFWERVS